MTSNSPARERPEHHYLAGQPKARLVKSVRRHLRLYGIQPHRYSQEWMLAWHWAHAVGASYYHFHWPSASEISAQYLLLVLAKMKSENDLRLPHRAAKVVPDGVRARLGEQLPLIGFAEKT
jgi:hypothetical protein